MTAQTRRADCRSGVGLAGHGMVLKMPSVLPAVVGEETGFRSLSFLLERLEEG